MLPSMLADEPIEPLLRIIELRDYRTLRDRILDKRTTDADLPAGEQTDLVKSVLSEVLTRRRADGEIADSG